MRRPDLILPLLSVLACAPTAGHRTQGTMAPASTTDSVMQERMVGCMNAVLNGSSFVDQVAASRPPRVPRKRYLTLRDPPGPHTKGLTFNVLPSSGAPRELVVEYYWPGRQQEIPGMQPPPDPKVTDGEGEALADIGTRLLREVKAQCAPTVPGEPVCARVAQGQVGRCVLGT